jgi:hypothetical protein
MRITGNKNGRAVNNVVNTVRGTQTVNGRERRTHIERIVSRIGIGLPQMATDLYLSIHVFANQPGIGIESGPARQN